MSGLEVVEQERFLTFELMFQAWMRHLEKSILILGNFKNSADVWAYPIKVSTARNETQYFGDQTISRPKSKER